MYISHILRRLLVEHLGVIQEFASLLCDHRGLITVIYRNHILLHKCYHMTFTSEYSNCSKTVYIASNKR